MLLPTRQLTARPDGDGPAINPISPLRELGAYVVSGLASGIDTAAHTAAIEAQGRTAAVVGTPLGVYYPPENRALQDRITKDF